jgi:hypothetical protein
MNVNYGNNGDYENVTNLMKHLNRPAVVRFLVCGYGILLTVVLQITGSAYASDEGPCVVPATQFNITFKGRTKIDLPSLKDTNPEALAHNIPPIATYRYATQDSSQGGWGGGNKNRRMCG